MTNMIEVRDVTRTYGSGPTAVQALHGVTFSVGEGPNLIGDSAPSRDYGLVTGDGTRDAAAMWRSPRRRT